MYVHQGLVSTGQKQQVPGAEGRPSQRKAKGKLTASREPKTEGRGPKAGKAMESQRKAENWKPKAGKAKGTPKESREPKAESREPKAGKAKGNPKESQRKAS